MKTAAASAAKYVANGTAATAVASWAADYIAALPSMFTKAIAAIPTWQANVATIQAANNMNKGLTRASQNQTAIATKVNGAGSASFRAGVNAAGTGSGDYVQFIGPWLTAVGTEVATLNQTNPRGTRAQNRARQAAYDAWIDTQAGNFRVK